MYICTCKLTPNEVAAHLQPRLVETYSSFLQIIKKLFVVNWVIIH